MALGGEVGYFIKIPMMTLKGSRICWLICSGYQTLDVTSMLPCYPVVPAVMAMALIAQCWSSGFPSGAQNQGILQGVSPRHL